MGNLLTIGNYRFNYVVIGNRQKPVILFLHGFMGSCEDFAEVANLLKEDFCCLLIDLPGHGKTEVEGDLDGETRRGFLAMRNRHVDYQMPEVAIAIVRLLKHLEIDRCFLVGYSMGGRLALYLAIFFPQNFYQVVLESASPGLEKKLDRNNRIKRDLHVANRLKTQNLDLFLLDWYANPLFCSFVKHPNYQQALAKKLNNNPSKLAKSLKYMGLGMQPSLWKHLKSIQLSTLLIVGKLDLKFVAINHKISAFSSRFEMKTVANTDHNVHFGHPLDFARLLKNFFSS